MEEKGRHFLPLLEKTETSWPTQPRYSWSREEVHSLTTPAFLVPPPLSSEPTQLPVLCLLRKPFSTIIFTCTPQLILYNFLFLLNSRATAYKFKEFQASRETPPPPTELSYEHLLFTRVQAESCQTRSATPTLTQRLPERDVWISCKDALSRQLKQKSANTAQHPTTKDNPSLFDSFSNPGSLTSCIQNMVRRRTVPIEPPWI